MRKFVVIGGGTGSFTVLRGLKKYDVDITAVVSMFDSGGSTGLLRDEFGILPPGDVRRALVALAEENCENIIRELFTFRFEEKSSLKGHSFGNLFLAALSKTTGSFESALRESSRILRVYGRVLPATSQSVRLIGQMSDGATVVGESRIPNPGKRIERVMLTPSNPLPTIQAITAIEEAQIITVGPGSLYTSIIPVLLVPEIASAIRVAKGLRVLIANIATQWGETDGYSLRDHLNAIDEHAGAGLFDAILVNNTLVPIVPSASPYAMLTCSDIAVNGIPVIPRSLVDIRSPWRHDIGALSSAFLEMSKMLSAGPREKIIIGLSEPARKVLITAST